MTDYIFFSFFREWQTGCMEFTRSTATTAESSGRKYLNSCALQNHNFFLKKKVDVKYS